MRRIFWILLLMPGSVATAGGPPALAPPAISSLISPKIYKRVTEDRDVDAVATLDDHQYAFHVAMLVHASFDRTRRILTDYRLYSQLISYVDRTDYSPQTHILDIQGGVWKWRLRSWVKFEEVGDHWIQYRIVGGHFTGLEGGIFFESLGEKGTLVYFNGGQMGEHWPPKLVITRGAEIVFGFTAKRMRSYIESGEAALPPPLIDKDAKLLPKPVAPSPSGSGDHKNDAQVPQPRNHL